MIHDSYFYIAFPVMQIMEATAPYASPLVTPCTPVLPPPLLTTPMHAPQEVGVAQIISRNAPSECGPSQKEPRGWRLCRSSMEYHWILAWGVGGRICGGLRCKSSLTLLTCGQHMPWILASFIKMVQKECNDNATPSLYYLLLLSTSLLHLHFDNNFCSTFQEFTAQPSLTPSLTFPIGQKLWFQNYGNMPVSIFHRSCTVWVDKTGCEFKGDSVLPWIRDFLDGIPDFMGNFNIF